MKKEGENMLIGITERGDAGVDLSYKVANVEVKKAAGEIVMDMDCNADVCENIYKKDGYSSMQEEFEKNNQN